MEKYGLLTGFIKRKLREYKEPQRKQTPKGKPIGLSREKYWATLLMLTNLNMKEMGKAVKVSHGVLRNWKGERQFRATVRKHYTEFARFFVDHIEEKVVERRQKIDEITNKSIEEIEKYKSDLTFDEYKDFSIYNTSLSLRIWGEKDKRYPLQQIEKTLEKLPLDEKLKIRNFFSMSERVWAACDRYSGKQVDPEWKQFLEKMNKRGSKKDDLLIIRVLIETLKRDTITDEERKAAIYALVNWRNILEEDVEILSKEMEVEEKKFLVDWMDGLPNNQN